MSTEVPNYYMQTQYMKYGNKNIITYYLMLGTDTIAQTTEKIECFTSSPNIGNIGWSCIYLRGALGAKTIERNIASARLLNMFLPIVCAREKYTHGDEWKIVQIWRNLSPNKSTHISTDSCWLSDETNFFDYFLYQYDTSRVHILNFDTCEKEHYENLWQDIKYNLSSIYLSYPNYDYCNVTDIEVQDIFDKKYFKLDFLRSNTEFLNPRISIVSPNIR